MTERNIVGAAITVFGLWRIFYGGMNDLFYVVVKQMGLRTASQMPVAIDIEGLVFDVLVGVIIIIAAPAILDLIYGGRTAKQP